MLLDPKENINYDYSAMGNETATATPPSTDMKPSTKPAAPERQIGTQRERLTSVIGSMLKDKAAKSFPEASDGTRRQPTTPGEIALNIYNDYLTVQPFTEDQLPFPEGTSDADKANGLAVNKPLTVPEFTLGEGKTERIIADGKITHIKAMYETEDHRRVFTCIVETGGKSEEVSLPAELVADAHLDAHGEEMLADATLFPPEEANERLALETYLKVLPQRETVGESPPDDVPDAILADLTNKYPDTAPATIDDAAETELLQKYAGVNAEIKNQIDALEAEINNLTGKEKENAQNRLLDLKIAQEINGELAVFKKVSVLTTARDATNDPTQKAILQQQIDAMTPLVETAREILATKLESSGVTQTKLDEWRNIANDPKQGILKLLEDPAIQNLPDMREAYFGRGFDQAKLDKIIADSHLPQEVKDAMLAGKIGKGLLWTLIIILGLPIAALGSAAVIATTLPGSFAGRNG